jgi:hypothetical protein
VAAGTAAAAVTTAARAAAAAATAAAAARAAARRGEMATGGAPAAAPTCSRARPRASSAARPRAAVRYRRWWAAPFTTPTGKRAAALAVVPTTTTTRRASATSRNCTRGAIATARARQIGAGAARARRSGARTARAPLTAGTGAEPPSSRSACAAGSTRGRRLSPERCGTSHDAPKERRRPVCNERTGHVCDQAERHVSVDWFHAWEEETYKSTWRGGGAALAPLEVYVIRVGQASSKRQVREGSYLVRVSNQAGPDGARENLSRGGYIYGIWDETQYCSETAFTLTALSGLYGFAAWAPVLQNAEVKVLCIRTETSPPLITLIYNTLKVILFNGNLFSLDITWFTSCIIVGLDR